jgi:L-2-hydroxyglutarate oxidase LhgO
MAEHVDAVVIGAGVVGLAVARSLALAGREVLVLEAGRTIGSGISARNSEVVHAGLYYPTGSLKARLCVRGAALLYGYASERGVAHRRCGKLIVATEPEQVDALRALQAQAERNGVTGLQWLAAGDARALEPELRCAAALLSPHTGIIDSHGLMLALQAGLEAHRGTVALNSAVHGGRVGDGAIELDVGDDRGEAGECMTLSARLVVNSAGLHAPQVARALRGFPLKQVPRSRLCKGSYFALAGRAPFSRLVYPMHQGAWLGVHLTLDLAGQARFGPDAEWLPEGTEPQAVDYHVDPARGDAFYAAVRRYWPGLPDGALVPAYAGVRPKIHGPDEPVPDFLIQGPEAHGVPGLVNLFGIESPGLTASLVIGEEVARLLLGA